MCQPLDNHVFKVSEARAGYNYPSMHPRCRNTTAMNIEFSGRRARNPLTGKNEIVDGDLTYSQWVDGLSEDKRNALKIASKKDDNKTADKLQYIKHKKVLGTNEVPKSFDKFIDVKYNDSEKWEILKSSSYNKENETIEKIFLFMQKIQRRY